jgi:nucleoside-diphosphate-sugar epimerase
MVYGPGQNDLQKLVPYVCLRAAAGESPRLMSGGRLVDWVYIDDVVDGLLSLAAGGPEDGSYVDLGSGRLVTTGKVAEMICEIAGTGVRPELGVVPDRPMEQVRRADAEATRKAVGWEARNGLAQGLERTYHWYRNLAAAGSAGPEDPGTL